MYNHNYYNNQIIELNGLYFSKFLMQELRMYFRITVSSKSGDPNKLINGNRTLQVSNQDKIPILNGNYQ